MEKLALNSAFWHDRRVLVTGHTGFKGSWLSLWLSALGAKVTGFSLDVPTTPSLMQAARVGDLLRDERGDVRDLKAVRAVMDVAKPEVVLHLAAQSLVRQSYAMPVETYATNVIGTTHLLEAVRTAKSVLAVIVVTSDKCYENRESGTPYVESDPMGGHDPYSSSKGAAELVTAAYRRSFFGDGKIASARAGNVVGGGDWSPDRLIPDIYRAAEANKALLLRNPKAVRPWQHVLEPLSGYLMLAEHLASDPAFAQAWNFGPDEVDARSVEDVVTRVVSRWSNGLRWELDRGAHPHEAKVLSIDSAKARQRLGWAPRLSLEETLAWTVDWYKAFMRGDDVRELTLQQISKYANRVRR